MMHDKIACAVAALLLLAGCYEPASTYDPKRGRYVDTEEYKRDRGVKEVCRRASCWDARSGRFLGADDWNERREDEAREDDEARE
jgi:hypothetical protein